MSAGREPPRVLLLRALGLGDFLTGVPAYRAVRRALPHHEIVLAAPGGLAPLAALAGGVDRLLPTGELQPVPWPYPPPRVAVDLHGNGPASRAIVEALHPARLIAFHPPAGARPAAGAEWRAGEHEVARWCRLLSAHGIPADPADLDLAAPPPVPGAAAGASIVHPGAAAPSRRWPARRFALVAARLRDAGHRVVITGSPAERALAEDVARQAGLPAAACVAGRTSLPALAALVSGARLVVSGDTGVAHLASAYRRPSVVLFGPVPPSEWGPPPRSRHVALWRARAGYRGDPHGQALDPALAALTVDDVLTAISSLTWADPPGVDTASGAAKRA